MADAPIPPTKRQRTVQDGTPPPPPPPPPEDDAAPPTDDLLPGPPGFPPPPPPPAEPNLDQAQNSDIVPPPPSSLPPPPPPSDVEEDEGDVQDAEYWTRLAQSSSSSPSVPTLSKANTASFSINKGPGRKSALYLDTINRNLLDFDFEKLCSISLSNINVYACLVCGRYFQGRGRNSYAYLHSIDDSHHVFMNLATAQTYILPDNYAVPEENQAGLQDIKYLLNPTFTRATIDNLDGVPAYDLNGEQYYPGFVGLNNVGKNDYVNAVVQALVHVPAVRDFFLEGKETEGEGSKSELVKRFGALVRKMWNPKAFKPQVSPHEFLQQVAQVSGNRFKITHQSDPVEFLGWLLNRLHADLSSSSQGGIKGGKRKRGAGGGESVISRCFQGVVQVESQPLVRGEDPETSANSVTAQAEAMLKNGTSNAASGGQVDDEGRIRFDPSFSVEKRDSPFFLLAMDLPTPPPVLGEEGENLVPQVTIGQVLSKYDGQSLHESNGKLTRYNLRRLPPFLIIHFRRFTKNSLGQEERNPTLVNFPIKGLDVTKHVPLLEQQQKLSEVYDLVANVVYDAVPGTVRQGASWKCQVHTNGKGKEGEKWFGIQDLLVEEVNRQMIFLGESYLQIWTKRSS
ncbi:related to SAD1 - protein required for assembly of U4 snRNA into the U4/U6 particle [Ustilago trichophora]|uniref:Related to SAD1 - protein required for assembly of U4 snRNA into the U4/U6 particle n=1 Tax=Ustilago trichophora TaxID=86804 RepID=A0A5C3DVS8_9BASI|nr:related to SAD1 - protein required for assembly of U4 snRNA into the U4/U6 particle [Ustilago trichophora]